MRNPRHIEDVPAIVEEKPGCIRKVPGLQIGSEFSDKLLPTCDQLGLVDETRYKAVEAKRETIVREMKRLDKTFFTLGEESRNLSATEFLRRPQISYQNLLSLDLGTASLNPEVIEQVEIEIKYQGYIEKQEKEVKRMHRLEERHIPQDIDYSMRVLLRPRLFINVSG